MMASVVVLYRGQSYTLPLGSNLTIGDVKRALSEEPESIKVLVRGKAWTDDEQRLEPLLSTGKQVHKLIAMGLSTKEREELEQQAKPTTRIRDDLTEEGQREIQRRQQLARRIMKQVDKQESSPYSFGRIEVLPNLPNARKARQILESLANDPGVLACMQKHEWSVGCLAELYPDGNVGQDPVCVMGLNQNKGQKILLRLRTDDLQGFRKMESIRQVLYHELAHNVHSEHDDQFFQLMRQIERECKALDWTHGEGLSASVDVPAFEGGTHRLGGDAAPEDMSPQERAAQAACRRQHPANCNCHRKMP